MPAGGSSLNGSICSSDVANSVHAARLESYKKTTLPYEREYPGSQRFQVSKSRLLWKYTRISTPSCWTLFREILQTLISIMLVSKFLCFRSLTFVVSGLVPTQLAMLCSSANDASADWSLFSRLDLQLCACFQLDLVEVTVGVGSYNYYLVDISNFLVILNSATNSLVFLKATTWLNNRLVERKTMRRKKTVCDAG